MINKYFGTSIKNKFDVFNILHDNKNDDLCVEASHNAYVKKFGYVHKRKLSLQENGDLRGSDHILNKNSNLNTDYAIRFHLYPGISAVQTISGNSILIQLKKNKSLFFSSEGNKISIENSIFLGRNKILNNNCITISGKTNLENKIISWNIKKNR
jgi:uncharacterized heparinase superfamily protein